MFLHFEKPLETAQPDHGDEHVSAPTAHVTREGWLLAATKAMRPWFLAAGAPLPERVQVGVSWPKAARGSANDVIGQCFSASWTRDDTVHAIVSPVLGNPVRVLDVLLHELCHAATPGTKHGKPFRDLAQRHFGLAGKVTSTFAAPGSAIWDRLRALSFQLGPYPHSKMVSGSGGPKKPAMGGWVRYRSPTIEGYTVVVSPKMVEEHGAPLDPAGLEMLPGKAS